jgi:hypothetical protein
VIAVSVANENGAQTAEPQLKEPLVMLHVPLLLAVPVAPHE